MKVDNLVKSAVILSIGIVIASVFIAHAASEMKSNERYVTVKGLAEREVKANKVIWPIAFNDVSNNLNSLYESIESKNKTIVDYLKKNGIKDSEINISSPSVFDRMAQSYVADNVNGALSDKPGHHRNVDRCRQGHEAYVQTVRNAQARHSRRLELRKPRAVSLHLAQRPETGND